MQPIKKQESHIIYQIISDQPDCCGECGCRLDLIETIVVNGDHLFVAECLGCHSKVFLIEE
jgi:hypothetical protein